MDPESQDSLTPRLDALAQDAAALSTDQMQLVKRCARDEEAYSLLLDILKKVNAPEETPDPAATSAPDWELHFLGCLVESPDLLLIEVDPEGRIIGFNHGCERVSGLSEAEVRGRAVGELVVRPSERAYFESVLAEVVRNPIQRSRHDFTWSPPSLSDKIISWTFTGLTGPDGKVASMVGIGTDITMHKRVEEKLFETTGEITAILDAFPDLTLRAEPDGRVLTIQGGGETPVIPDPEDLPGRRIQDALEPSVARDFESAMHRVSSEGEVVRFDYSVVDGETRRDVEARFLPLPSDQVFIVLRDITARAREKRALEDLVAGTASVTGDAFFQAVVRHMARALELPFAFIAERSGSGNSLRIRSCFGGEFAEYLQGLPARGPFAETLLECETLYYSTAIRDQYPGDLIFQQLGVESVLGSPLRTPEGETLGFLCVLDTKPITGITRARSILEIFAARTTAELARMQAESKLEEARRREVSIGARIQQTLLYGRPPENLDGVAIGSLSVPSQAIDGDFFDFVEYTPRRFDVIVGDVMGKGVPAALLGAATRAHFVRAVNEAMFARESFHIPRPEDIVNRVNADITPELIAVESFITACYARFDLERGELCFVDCGHTKTIHYRKATDDWVLLEGRNFPFGIAADETYEETTVPIAEGDFLFFYSDCVTETRSPEGTFFGEERLAETIRGSHQLDPSILVHGLSRLLLEYSQQDGFQDDLTCVGVRIGATSAEPYAEATVTVPSTLDGVPEMRTRVSEFLATNAGVALHGPMLAEFELAITEATANVVKHASEADKPHDIAACCRLFADRIEIELSYEGEGFDRTAVPEPSFDGSRSGGFGLYIIDRTMDEVTYSQCEDGKQSIRLVKDLNTSRSDDEPGN